MILLDIVIQFGKFFSDSSKSDANWLDWFLKYFITPFLSFSFALFLYYLKKGHDKKKENEIKQKQNENDLRYFDTVVRNILIDVPKQIKAYKDYAEIVKAEPHKSHELSAVIIENLNRILNKYDQQKLFHSYIAQFEKSEIDIATKKFMELYKSLDVYLKLYNDAITVNTRLNTEIDNRLNIDYIGVFRSSLLPKFERFCEAIIVNNDLIMMSYINNVKNEYNLQEDKRPQISQDFLISKLLAKYNEIRKYPIGEEMLFDCQIMSSIYNNVVSNSIFQADRILTLSEDIETAISKITDNNNETNSLLLK